MRPPREFADNLALTVYDEEAAYGRLELWLAENQCERVMSMTTLQSTLGPRVMVVMTEKRLYFLDMKSVIAPVVLFEVKLMHLFHLVPTTEHSFHHNESGSVSKVGEADFHLFVNQTTSQSYPSLSAKAATEFITVNLLTS